MGRDETRLLGLRHIVERVGHLQRSEDAPTEILVERQAGDLLDQAAEPIRAGAVHPLLAGLEQQRTRGVAGTRLVIAERGAREAVAEAGGVREEVAHGYGLGGRPQLVGAGCRIERLQHRLVGKVRKILLRRIVEGDVAALDELHGGDRGDRLGHRGNPEQRVELHGTSSGNVGHAERALIDDAAAIGRHGDDTGYLLAIDRVAQRLVDNLRLLRTRRQWKHRRPANQSDKVAPPHGPRSRLPES